VNEKLAVIGTGRMGSALATALFHKGFTTTVWNRTASKTEPLAQLGLRVAQSVLEAIKEGDVIIVNVINYNATRQLLQRPEVESALRSKILVQLTTGTPNEAREMEAWAQPRGIRYLDGAIVGYPAGIGKPESTILYSGSEELFNRVKPVLLAFGDNALLVGNEIGHASALDVAILAFAMNAMSGFLHGYVVCEEEHLPLETYMQFVKSLMPVLEMTLAGLHGTIREKNYGNTEASLEVYAACPRALVDWCEDHGVDHSLADAQLFLIEKAIKAGKGQSDFAYLYEVLRRGSD
jgi:3-hydroxyisobutyrate dehydrogenase-like beta-hydroxyacid dehydrogenase